MEVRVGGIFGFLVVKRKSETRKEKIADHVSSGADGCKPPCYAPPLPAEVLPSDFIDWGFKASKHL